MDIKASIQVTYEIGAYCELTLQKVAKTLKIFKNKYDIL